MNAPVRIGMPLTREARLRARIAAVTARYHAAWLKLTADMQAEIRAIEREEM
jgi:hypothetical protein